MEMRASRRTASLVCTWHHVHSFFPLAIVCGPLFPGPCSTTSRVPACSLVLQGFQPLTEMPDGGLTMEREYSYTEQHNMHSVLFFMMDYDKNGASEPLPPSGPM